MKNLTVIPLLFVTLLASDVRAQAQWQVVKSMDGIVQALLPGTPKGSIEKSSSLAGTFTTYVSDVQRERVSFTVSSTNLGGFARKLAGDEKIYSAAKDGVLKKYRARETSFDQVTISGVPARSLRYKVDDSRAAHKGCHGIAVFVIHGNSTYVANGLVSKDAGDADLNKFRASIKINK